MRFPAFLSSNRVHPSFVRVILGLLVCASVLFAQDQSVELKGRLEAQIPSDLKALLMSNPYAEVLVEVNEVGAVIDLMPESATHFGLLEKALAVVQEAEFVPAMADGVPCVGRIRVYVNFYDIEQRAWRMGAGIMPLGGSASDAVERRLYNMSPSKFVYGESKPTDLDQPLSILSSTFRLYASDPANPKKGQCVVEYLIGPEGRVHFPSIISSDHDDLSTSALLTLRETVFDPPLHGGNPTWVRVRQPFNFD